MLAFLVLSKALAKSRLLEMESSHDTAFTEVVEQATKLSVTLNTERAQHSSGVTALQHQIKHLQSDLNALAIETSARVRKLEAERTRLLAKARNSTMEHLEEEEALRASARALAYDLQELQQSEHAWKKQKALLQNQCTLLKSVAMDYSMQQKDLTQKVSAIRTELAEAAKQATKATARSAELDQAVAQAAKDLGQERAKAIQQLEQHASEHLCLNISQASLSAAVLKEGWARLTVRQLQCVRTSLPPVIPRRGRSKLKDSGGKRATGKTNSKNTGVNATDWEEKMCVVCCDAEPDHIIMDCMHMCLCGVCVQHYKGTNAVCPKCRSEVTEIKKIFY